MSLKNNSIPGIEINSDMGEPAEEKNGFARIRNGLAEMKATKLMRLYRFASLALSSALFIVYPGTHHLYTQLGLIFLLLTIAVLFIFIYEYFSENIKILSLFLVLETVGIALLLAYTGGIGSAFIWYALNPFIVASTAFSFTLAWLLLGTLFAGTYWFDSYFLLPGTIWPEVMPSTYYPVVNLLVIASIIHLYSKAYMFMSERLMERNSQKYELMSAQENLTANYQVFKGLSNFQREAVAYNNQKDIYSTLLAILINIFPFRQAAVLVPPPDFEPERYSDDPSIFQVIGSNKEKAESDALLIRPELESRWSELNRVEAKKPLISENRHWIALPLRGENKNITAVFVGWVKPNINPLSFAENLFLFIRFAEQTTEWLSMFKQKERVLQHISAVYEAVETVSSQSDPRVVIDLFASYAKALTDCEKTIFWMLHTGDSEEHEEQPIYAVKGPLDVFPEEEWHGTLLQVWSEIHIKNKPVIVDLEGESEAKAQLISVPIKTGSQCFGMLSCVQSNKTFSTEEVVQILTVLAELSSVAVVRARAEKFAEKLLVIEEQKRIASEIHDTISQNLFSIVYSIDALSREAREALSHIQQETLEDVKNLSAETAKELRSLIYRLSPGQDANETFIDEVTGYLNKMARMNAITIKHTIQGGTEYLNPAICKTLYRIIKESTGNALKHGKCTEILVHLDITPFDILLKVSDNGNGFDVHSSLNLYTSGNRLGIVNMRELALSLQGALNIDSKPGRGTEVTCSIPTSPVSVE